MKLQTSSARLSRLPPYLFAELDRKKAELISRGVDVINLGIGDPDQPPPPRMIEALKEALSTPQFHRYPSYNGAEFFREAISKWLASSHNITIDPHSELIGLIGSKEGLAHLPQAVLNPGDSALITDPCYPVHLQSMLLAGANPITIPLSESGNFLPDLSSVPEKYWREAKLIILNYPNNPTSSVATKEFFSKIVKLAHEHNFIVCHDAAYIDICLEGQRQPSLMSVAGAKDVSVEFFSLSKMFNITGWRLGFCIGNKGIIKSLAKFKTAVDSGQFTALQKAAAVGLAECLPELKKTLALYKERRHILCNGLDKIGLTYFKSNSTFYVWTKVPEKYKSQEYANLLLEKLGVIVAPGIGFGKTGDNYIRFSLTSSTERIAEATRRMDEIRLL